MRVRNLNIYLREQGLLRQGSLSTMRGMRVGIDAIYFFRSLKGICDPLSEVGGSLSPIFMSVVEDNLAYLDRLGIQPLFVFEGMQSRSHILLSAQLMTLSVAEGWLAYSRGDLPNAISKFVQSSLIFSEDIIQLLVSTLRSKGKDAIRCPYFAGAQLSYFCAEGIVDAILGPPSIMLFGVPRCIVSVDSNKNSFEWVELKEVLMRMELSHTQLVDVCLMAGTEHCLSFPSQNTFSFANCVEMIKQAPMAKHISQLPQREGITEYVDGYCVTKTIVTLPLILDRNGVVRPLQKNAKIPVDYHKVVGMRIPQGIYHLLGQGIISSKIPLALATGEWVDEFSLTDAVELRELLQDTREYKCRALGLAVLKLDPCYQGRQIKFKGHVAFIKGHTPIKQSSVSALPNTCSTRMLSPHAIGELPMELERQNTDHIDAEFVLKWHLKMGSKLFKEVLPSTAAYAVARMFIGPSGSQKTADKQIFKAHMWCILLENLGYFTKQGGVSAFGKVMANSGLGMTGLLFMELLKFGMFTGEEFEVPADVTISPEVVSKSRGTLPQDIYEPINLVSRIACLHPAIVDNGHWRGEIDYAISNYISHIKVMRRCLNHLLEGILILLGGVAKEVETPYLLESNCFMANVLKWMLTNDNDQRDGSVNVLEAAQSKFPNIVDMKENLQSFAKFWAKVSNLLHELENYVHIEALDTFNRGTKMLHKLFVRIGVSM
ncbi:hypothetical protein X943_003786 [Babesia divergens]|uniref:XPG N-terminal domain-containing protein n=1 Tax=Babesia divergens TaxID=32595 RepID=A0AAD9LJ96_BABDI|nr:hypothetical protein X943_003786 [Babesia divergens]